MNFAELRRVYLFWLSHLANRALARPDYVGVLLTKRCNLKCKMCHIRDNPTTPDNELSFGEIKKIIDDISDWGVRVVTLTGGEPFLRKDFFEIAEYAMNRIRHVAINTNLTLVDKEIAEKICRLPRHKFHLEVSLDGARQETHDYIRGTPGSFNRIMEGVSLIRQVSSENKTDVHIGTTFVLMEENLREVMDLVGLASRHKFVNVSLMPKLLSNVELQKRADSASMSEEALAVLDNTIMALLEHKKNSSLVINPEASLRLYKDYFLGTLSKRGICNAGYMGPNIIENGNVFICTYLIGNIKKNSIRDIWYSKEANKVRYLSSKCQKPCLQHYSIRFQEASPFWATASFLKKNLFKNKITRP